MLFAQSRSAGLRDESDRTIPPRSVAENCPAAGCARWSSFFSLARLQACDCCLPIAALWEKVTVLAPCTGSWCRTTAPDNGNGLVDACKIVTANGTIGCLNGASRRAEPVRTPNSLMRPLLNCYRWIYW